MERSFLSDIAVSFQDTGNQVRRKGAFYNKRRKPAAQPAYCSFDSAAGRFFAVSHTNAEKSSPPMGEANQSCLLKLRGLKNHFHVATYINTLATYID